MAATGDAERAGAERSAPERSAPERAGADFLLLSPADAPVRGLTGWLADAIRAAIIDGRLRTGASLPATRLLAEDLGVSRGVIVEAYQRLTDEGLISARAGAGTRVLGVRSTGLGAGAAAQAQAQGRGCDKHTTGTATLSQPHPSGLFPEGRSGLAETAGAAVEVAGAVGLTAELAAGAGGLGGAPGGLGGAPGMLPQRWRARAEIDLSPGVPDLAGFPRAAWLRAERAVLEQASLADLGYGDPRGSEWLRTELAGWLARRRGLRAEPGDIIIVTGVAQALALVAQWLAARSLTRIAVEDPGSRGSVEELTYWGLAPEPVAVDEHGLRAADLAASDARTVVLTPAHQFPTGVVLGPKRRRELLDWAARTGGLILEDDYDAEYRYDRAPVPAVQGSGPDLVIYAGSTSKTLAPGMRLGWLIPPRRMHADLVEAKHAADLGSPALPQLVLARMIASGELEHHLRLVRRRQRIRRDALLGALREHLPQAQVQGIAAGLHLLITFGGLGRPDTDLAEEILRSGVLVHPLSWHRHRPGPPGLVLGYAAHTPDQLAEAARRIAGVVTGAGLSGSRVTGSQP